MFKLEKQPLNCRQMAEYLVKKPTSSNGDSLKAQ
jgi:hypothetical protein